MIVFWLIVGAWLVACVLAIRWTLPRLDASDKESDHEEALKLDKIWNVYMAARPVPPILNQSERKRTPPAVFDLPRNMEKGFQERARKAEHLGFRDDDSGPWVA